MTVDGDIFKIILLQVNMATASGNHELNGVQREKAISSSTVSYIYLLCIAICIPCTRYYLMWWSLAV